MSHILIIEDDLFLRGELLRLFAREGFSATAVDDFFRAEQEVKATLPDLLLLDLNLPYHSGFELCQKLKNHYSFPILILTGRDTLEDELRSLALGADEFLTKPCPPQRLLARCNKLLQSYREQSPKLRAGDLRLEKESGRLSLHGHSVLLSSTEAKLLACLMEKAPDIVCKEKLRRSVWGEGAYIDPNTLQVSIGRLRRRLAELGLSDCLVTRRGLGYALELS